MSKIIIERPFECHNQSHTNIYINNENIGHINSGKNIELEVSPGRHKVAVKRAKSLLNKPIIVNVCKDENKIIRVVSYQYSRVTWPLLFIVLFGIYQATGISFKLNMRFILLLLVYTVVIYIFKHINSKFVYYKLEEVEEEM